MAAAPAPGATELDLADVRILNPTGETLPATVVGGTVTVEGQARLWLPLVLRTEPRW